MAFEFNKLTADQPAVPDSPSDVRTEGPAPGLTPAQQKFQSCRWRRPAENENPGCCTHRDVFPITGAHGFDPEAWCPDCTYYKVRRTPRKPQPPSERY